MVVETQYKPGPEKTQQSWFDSVEQQLEIDNKPLHKEKVESQTNFKCDNSRCCSRSDTKYSQKKTSLFS